MAKQRVCAIIPAYKEAKRIEGTLIEIEKCKNVDEIIVVDDGSNDGTEAVVIPHKRVTYIKNKKNMGKGYAMDIGVKNTSCNILFFCDADLIGFTSNMIDDIINELSHNGKDMCIAVRHKINNKFLTWSGQRAIKRELWENLPDFYKKGFRIELGLNFKSKKFSTYECNYSQHIKESKHGIVGGFYRRIFMLYHIFTAYVRYFMFGI